MKKIILQITLVISTLLVITNVKAQCLTITCPGSTIVNNDSGLCSALVTYAAPVPNDPCTIVRDTFFYTGAIVNWTVPAGITNLNIEAKGAEGGYTTSSGVFPGLGAIMIGDFTVNPGDVLKVLIGENNNAGNGGGGGSFVTNASNTPLIIAGGGGGAGGNTDSPAKHGQVGTSGGTGAGGGGTGGTAGNGGNAGASFAAGAGGGLLTDGANGWLTGSGGQAFVNGGAGANVGYGIGGFGAGGNGSGNQVGGGGGGYSGGGGGSNSAGAGVGGGGASFNSGTNQNNSGGTNTGHGMVVFSYTNLSSVTVTQLAGLSSGSAFPVGVTINTFQVSDGIQIDTCSFTVTVVDAEIPTVSCPANITSCDPAINGIAPTTADNCTGETVAYNLTSATTGSGISDASGTIFNVGTTAVKYIVTDMAGNKDSCSFDITINPLPAVIIDAFSPDTICEAGGAINLPAGTPASGTYSGNGVSGSTFDPAIDGIGSYYVVYTYTDANTCTNSDSTLVVVASCVGINESSALPGISIFPNPTSNTINITLEKVTAPLNFKLTSIDGKVVYHLKNITDKSTAIDISKINTGVYFLRVGNEIDFNVYKVIKQ